MFPDGGQAMDLSSLGISELTAIINGDDFSFTDVKGEQPDFSSLIDPPTNQGLGNAMTPGTQAATDNLMAALGAPHGPTEQPGQIAEPEKEEGKSKEEQNVDELLASLETTQNGDTAQQPNTNPDGSNFDYDFNAMNSGGVDLSQLVGLLSDAKNMQPPIPPPSANTQEQQKFDLLLEDAGQVGESESYVLGGIDLDDFNFGDGSIPNVEGDEFERMFAEFDG